MARYDPAYCKEVFEYMTTLLWLPISSLNHNGQCVHKIFLQRWHSKVKLQIQKRDRQTLFSLSLTFYAFLANTALFLALKL